MSNPTDNDQDKSAFLGHFVTSLAERMKAKKKREEDKRKNPSHSHSVSNHPASPSWEKSKAKSATSPLSTRPDYGNPQDQKMSTLQMLSPEEFESSLKEGKFERGEDVPLEDLPEEPRENVGRPPPPVVSLKEEMVGKKAKLMSRQEKILREYMAGSSHPAMEYDSLPQHVRDALTKIKDQETLESDVDRFLSDNRKTAAVTLLATSDYELLINKEGKFEKGEPMTVDEVSDVVGPEFKKMNEDPPESVLKVKKEIEGRTATSLLTANDYEALLNDKEGKFERGKSMTLDEVVDVVGPEFKKMNEDPPESVLKIREEMEKDGSAKPSARTTHLDDPKKEGFTLCGERIYPETLRESIKDTSCFYCKQQWDKSPGSKEACENEAPDLVPLDAIEENPFKTASTGVDNPNWASLRFMTEVRNHAVLATKAVAIHDLPAFTRGYRETLNSAAQIAIHSNLPNGPLFARTLWKLVEKFIRWDAVDPDVVPTLKDEAWEASIYQQLRLGSQRVAASGLYGSTKELENTCTASGRKLQATAKKLAKALYAKDEDSPSFLAEHGKRTGNRAAKVLVAAMKEIGPAASLAKTAGRSGLYGFKERTAKLAIDACGELTHEAGLLASDMNTRKAGQHDKVTGFLRDHAKTAKCIYSAMLLEAYPSAPVVEEAPLLEKKASGWYQANYVDRDVTGGLNPSTEEILSWDRAVQAADFLASEDEDSCDESPPPVKVAGAMAVKARMVNSLLMNILEGSRGQGVDGVPVPGPREDLELLIVLLRKIVRLDDISLEEFVSSLRTITSQRLKRVLANSRA